MARACQGTTAGGKDCRRPPGVDSDHCAAHSPDPERHAAHIEASRAGGIARHDDTVSAAKAEIADLKAALWSRKVSPGAASVLLQAMRLEREIDHADRMGSATDTLVDSIVALRAANPPDLSEPDTSGAANIPTGGITAAPVDDPPEPYDPDAPLLEDYRRADGALDGEAYIRDSRAHAAVPLGHLSVAERRNRWQSGQRG
jgi:hypothetical protein